MFTMGLYFLMFILLLVSLIKSHEKNFTGSKKSLEVFWKYLAVIPFHIVYYRNYACYFKPAGYFKNNGSSIWYIRFSVSCTYWILYCNTWFCYISISSYFVKKWSWYGSNNNAYINVSHGWNYYNSYWIKILG